MNNINLRTRGVPESEHRSPAGQIGASLTIVDRLQPSGCLGSSFQQRLSPLPGLFHLVESEHVKARQLQALFSEAAMSFEISLSGV